MYGCIYVCMCIGVHVRKASKRWSRLIFDVQMLQAPQDTSFRSKKLDFGDPEAFRIRSCPESKKRS